MGKIGKKKVAIFGGFLMLFKRNGWVFAKSGRFLTGNRMRVSFVKIYGLYGLGKVGKRATGMRHQALERRIQKNF